MYEGGSGEDIRRKIRQLAQVDVGMQLFAFSITEIEHTSQVCDGQTTATIGERHHLLNPRMGTAGHQIDRDTFLPGWTIMGVDGLR